MTYNVRTYVALWHIRAAVVTVKNK